MEKGTNECHEVAPIYGADNARYGTVPGTSLRLTPDSLLVPYALSAF